MKQFNEKSRGALYRIAFFILCIFLTPTELLAQNTNVRFTKETLSIKKALKEIENQTDYTISVNYGNLDASQKVKLSKEPMEIKEALSLILNGTVRTFEIHENNILIIPITATIKVDKTTEHVDQEELMEKYLTEGASDTPNSKYLNSPFLEAEASSSHYSNFLAGTAIKMNLLYGAAALAPNLGVEIGLSPNSTLDIWGAYNGWKLKGTDTDNKKMAHWIGLIEYRYWFCERFNGHFVGFHGFGGAYNISGYNIPLLLEENAEKYRYEGSMYGVGISYGYQLVLGKNWNLEFNLGVGYGFMKYNKFECVRCGDKLEQDTQRHYFGPTRAGITLAYILK